MNLRDGIRSAKQGDDGRARVVCKAGNYHKIYSVDENKDVMAEDIPQALGKMKCEPSEPALDLPANFNDRVVAVQAEFEKHIREWQAEQIVAVTMPLSQKYVIDELQAIDREIDDPNWQGQISTYLHVYSQPLTQAVQAELRGIRRNRVEGQALLDLLDKIYVRYKLSEAAQANGANHADKDIPIVVCSLAHN